MNSGLFFARASLSARGKSSSMKTGEAPTWALVEGAGTEEARTLGGTQDGSNAQNRAAMALRMGARAGRSSLHTGRTPAARRIRTRAGVQSGATRRLPVAEDLTWAPGAPAPHPRQRREVSGVFLPRCAAYGLLIGWCYPRHSFLSFLSLLPGSGRRRRPCGCRVSPGAERGALSLPIRWSGKARMADGDLRSQTPRGIVEGSCIRPRKPALPSRGRPL